MKFTELGLAEPIVRAVSDKGYTTPSPIQAQAIPVAVQGRDVFGCAQTGTGKTCAFALPILDRLTKDNPGKQRKGGFGRAPRALVLAPTRELAMQIFDSFVSYGKHLKHLRHTVVFGGVSQGKQVRSLRDGVDVLVATPGRLLDLINQGHIDLSNIEVLVLDEADRMLDMGFINDIRKVVAMTREDRQTLFFSATVSREIRSLSSSILTNPVSIETAVESTTVDAIEQCIYMVEREQKPELLERVLMDPMVSRSLVFSKTKYGCDKLVKMLRRANIDAEAIHGDKSQNARTRAMRRFKSGSTKILIATDIASRGIDVDNITHVVNYDMPLDPETYVHRIGRTARAGAQGIAISFCGFDEIGLYRQVERRSQIQIPVGQDHDDLTFEAPPPSRSVRSSRSGGGYKGKRNQGGSRFGGGGGGRSGGRSGGRKSYAERNGSAGSQGGGGYQGRFGSRDERSNDRGNDQRSDRGESGAGNGNGDRPRSGGKYRKSNDRGNDRSNAGAPNGAGSYAGPGANTEASARPKKPKKPKIKVKKSGAKAKGPKESFSARTPKPKKGNGYPKNKPGTGVKRAPAKAASR